MQTHRIISGLTIFLMVALIAVGYFVVAQPQIAAAATANDQLTAVSSQITASQATINRLKREQATLPALRKKLTALRGSIPTDAQISSYIDGLNALASSNAVAISGITVAPAIAYTAPAPAAGAAAPAPAATATPSPSASASADDPAAPAVTSTDWAPTTDPTITSSNFVAIPVTVTLAGQTPNMLAFIKGLQSGTRLFLVSGISTSSDAANPGAVTGTITGYIYVLLDSNATATNTTGTSTATPTPTATATPTATVTPSPSGTATPTPSQSPTPTKKP